MIVATITHTCTECGDVHLPPETEPKAEAGFFHESLVVGQAASYLLPHTTSQMRRFNSMFVERLHELGYKIVRHDDR